MNLLIMYTVAEEESEASTDVKQQLGLSLAASLCSAWALGEIERPQGTG